MKPNVKPLAGLLLGGLLLSSGCALGPNYQSPDIELADSYLGAEDAPPLENIEGIRWWQSFNDPLLNQWVDEGLGRSLDIGQALERITSARAVLRGTGVNAALSGDLSAQSIQSGGEGIATTTSDSVTLSGNFAIDIFGGIRRQREAAMADYRGAIDDAQTAQLAYLSELVSAYIDARYYQYAIVLTQQSIASRLKTLKITQKQRSVGSSTELEEEQIKALLYNAEADIPDLRGNFLEQVYALATLLNKPVASILTQMEASAPGQEKMLGLTLATPYATGIPADLLRNRPDVRAAEQSLKSAVADIGVAKANRFPSLTLSGSLTDENNAWNFGPILSLPIFNQGALSASQSQAQSAAKIAELQYRQTVLEAVQDVQSASSTWLRGQEKVEKLQASVNSYNRALDLSLETYQVGVMTLLDLLDTDRSLASARLSFAQALRDLSKNWANLQIALGAGAAVQTQS